MKEKLIYIFALVLAICQTSCVSEVNQDLDITSNKVSKGAELENIAKLLASIDFDNNEVKKIHGGVTTALNNGLHEVYFMKELMGEDCKVVKETDQTRVFVDFIKSQVENKSLSQALSYYREFENDEKLQIYWPFSENWDGKTKPVISYLPDDNSQDKNIGYYYEGGELKSVVVDREYAKTHPVWIVNESMMGYNNIPDFNNFREGDFLNIAPRNIASNGKCKPKFVRQSGRIRIARVRAIHNQYELFFCESITYTFVYSLPVGPDYSNVESCEVVVTMSESELNSQEFREISEAEHVGIENLIYDSEVNSNLHLAISRVVNPRTILRPQPFLIKNNGVDVEIMSELEIAEEQSLYYETMIDLDTIIHAPRESLFSYGELEWVMLDNYFVGI